MTLYDISVPIANGMPVWPGDPEVALRQVESIQAGAEANVSQIQMSVHTGTHIDAPKHFFDAGSATDQIPLRKLMGPTLVMVIESKAAVISAQLLRNHPEFNALQMAKKVLFKTRNSNYWHSTAQFQTAYVGVDASGARLLADLGLELVGVDYLSVAPFRETDEPHQILLEKSVVLLEGIDLSAAPAGWYELLCLPLALADCEGAPARAVLRTLPADK